MINILITYVIQIALFHYYISHFLHSFRKIGYIYFFYIVGLFIVVSMNLFMGIQISSIFMYVLNIVYVIIFFKESILNKILYVGSFLVIASVSEMLTVNTLMIFLDNKLLMDPLSNYYLMGMIVSSIIEFFFLYIFIKFMKFKEIVQVPKYFWMIFLLPFFTIILIKSISGFALISKANQIESLAISIGLLIANIGILYIFSITLENLDAKNKMEIALQKEKLAILNYELLIKQNDSHYRVLHDTRNQLNSIMTLARDGEYKKLKLYTYNLYRNITKTLTYTLTGVPLLNLLLDNMLNDINYKDINIKTQFENKDFDFMDIYDQMILFKNILLLAMNNSLMCKEEERFIIIKSFKLNNQIHIIVHMSINLKLEYMDIILTIEKITNKYLGSYTLDLNKINTCKLILSFPYNN